MPKKVAVICAFPPGRNTGMATVDLAALSVMPGILEGADVNFYCFHAESKYSYGYDDIPVKYRYIEEFPEEYMSSDAFIFWGDFIHSRSYMETDLGLWVDGAETAENEARRKNYLKYIFLSFLPDSDLHKVGIFGSTIYTNNAYDMIDAEYRQSFERLVSGAGFVFFRDALSAAKVAPYRAGQASLACDCAFLLKNDDLSLLKGYKPVEGRSGVGVFFGRTNAKFAMMAFAKAVAGRLGQKCVWLPWFFTRKNWRIGAKFFGYDIPSKDADVGAIISQLSGCAFVITDTYHLCVNAWRLGIPAICIGRGADYAKHSLSDKKKEILYDMYGARGFYVFVESLFRFAGFAKSVDAASSALSNPKLTQEVTRMLQSHIANASSLLRSSAKKLIADDGTR